MFFINYKDMKWFVEKITKWLTCGNMIRPGLLPVPVKNKNERIFRHE